MRAPVTDKQLLEMMWERFPEIMQRGVELPAQQEPVAEIVADADGYAFIKWHDAKPSFYDDHPIGTKFYTFPPHQKPLTDERIEGIRVEQEFDQWAISKGAFKYAARAIEAAHGIKENT